MPPSIVSTITRADDGSSPRPATALIYVAEGEIVEYASNCAVPIVHKAGEVRAENNGTSHWWKNHTNAQVILFIGDVRRDPNDHNM